MKWHFYAVTVWQLMLFAVMRDDGMENARVVSEYTHFYIGEV